MQKPEQLHIAREFTTYGNVEEKVTTKVNSLVRTFERSDYTDPLQCLTGCFPVFESFRYRKIKAPVAFAWLAFQMACILYQELFVAEMDRHLEKYENHAMAECGPEHMQHGVCLGPHWKFAYAELVHFSASDLGDFDFRVPADKTFQFSTHSSPATMLVVVEPQTPSALLHYHFSIVPKGGQRETALTWKTFGSWGRGAGGRRPCSGKTVMVFEERRESTPGNEKHWEGRLTLDTQPAEPLDMHVYVVDSLISHLQDIRAQPMCSFENSWIRFTQMSHHDVLAKTRFFTRLFQLIQIVAVALVFYRYYYQVEGSRLFNRVVFFKLLMQDFPQQICMVVYMYAWYGQNGMRCQLCLLEPEHCTYQYPLHTSNLVACLLTMISAGSAQMLIQVTYKALDEDDLVCFMCGRLIILSVCILPFSTAVLFASTTVLHIGSGLITMTFVLFAFCGWGAVCCTPMLVLCDDI